MESFEDLILADFSPPIPKKILGGCNRTAF